jgi:hypothetical protein
VRTACPCSWTSHPEFRLNHGLTGYPQRRRIAYSQPRTKLWGSPQSFSKGRLNNCVQVTEYNIQTSFSVGFFQLSKRIASGSLMPSGISLMYVLARFFSFRPYTARSRSFCLHAQLTRIYFKVTANAPVEGSGGEQDKDHAQFLLSNADATDASRLVLFI